MNTSQWGGTGGQMVSLKTIGKVACMCYASVLNPLTLTNHSAGIFCDLWWRIDAGAQYACMAPSKIRGHISLPPVRNCRARYSYGRDGSEIRKPD